nr:hypothetical protein [Proteus vulgaris]
MISHLLLGSNSKTEINFIFFHTFPPPKKLRTIIITIPPPITTPLSAEQKNINPGGAVLSIGPKKHLILSSKKLVFCSLGYNL